MKYIFNIIEKTQTICEVDAATELDARQQIINARKQMITAGERPYIDTDTLKVQDCICERQIRNNDQIVDQTVKNVGVDTTLEHLYENLEELNKKIKIYLQQHKSEDL